MIEAKHTTRWLNGETGFWDAGDDILAEKFEYDRMTRSEKRTVTKPQKELARAIGDAWETIRTRES